MHFKKKRRDIAKSRKPKLPGTSARTRVGAFGNDMVMGRAGVLRLKAMENTQICHIPLEVLQGDLISNNPTQQSTYWRKQPSHYVLFTHLALISARLTQYPIIKMFVAGTPLITAECESALKFVYIQIAYDSN